MADDSTRAELDQLRTQLAAQQTELAVLRRAIHTRPRRLPRIPRRFVPFVLVGLLLALTPLSIGAANPFTDLVPNSVHNANIDAIYNAGITTGCVPNAQYCPTDFVTRQEMASFLARTAGLGVNPPVTNAKSLNGVPAANYVQTGSSATLANLTVTGTINSAFTSGTTNRATPIAYGYVSAAGALISGTPNVSVVYVPGVSQHYEITITGETFVYNEYQALVTPTYSVSTTPHIVNTSSDSGKLLVYVYTPNTGAITSGAFQFAIFKP